MGEQEIKMNYIEKKYPHFPFMAVDHGFDIILKDLIDEDLKKLEDLGWNF